MSEGVETEGEKLSFDELVDALADVQRRRLLLALVEQTPHDDTTVGIAELEDAERLVALRHVHLPKLADYGLIEYDEATSDVTSGPTFEEIRPLLELLDEHEAELPDDWV